MNRWVVVLGIALVAQGMLAGASGAGPRFGITVGPQGTELAARSYPGIGWPDERWKTSGFGGAIVELPLPGRLAVASGIEYGGFGDEKAFGVTIDAGGTPITNNSRLELRQRVLSMPVRLEWRPGHWRLGAGPELRYMAGAEQRWQVSAPAVLGPNLAASRGRVAGPAAQIFESVQLDRWQDAAYLFRRWSLAAQLAVGREVPLGTHALRADLRWSEGVTHQQWAPSAAQRTRAAQLAFGLLW